MKSSAKAERKYLEAHAEPEAALAERLGDQPFGETIVIPAYGETAGLPRVLESIPRSPAGSVLTIVVVNGRADSPPAVHQANLRTCELLNEGAGPGSELAPGIWRLERQRGPLVLIERASAGRFLPARQGVGLARKLGADFALAVAARGGLVSPFIHCTDADAVLPEDYFETAHAYAEEDAAALVRPFRHVHFGEHGVEEPSDVALEYELTLRYYVLGLRFAGSPDAFHTIGSTISVHRDAYAKVRGFPRRLAAEDFHLLAKLRKQGPIVSTRGDPLLLSDRASSRVPFGTGAAIRRVADGGALRTYPPVVFVALRTWLTVLSAACRAPAQPLAVPLLQAANALPEAIAEALVSALREAGRIDTAERVLREQADPEQRLRRLHDGFDALATLRLIHALRDRCAPSVPVRDALALAPFLETNGSGPLVELREALERAECQGELAPR